MSAADHHQIHLSCGHHLVGQLGIVDAPGGGDRQLAFAPNSLGDRGQEGRSPGDLRLCNGEAHADAEQIQTAGAKLPGELDGLLERLGIPAIILDDPEAGGEWQVFRPDIADGGEGFSQKTAATGIVATVGVGALVAVCREEALGQIAVRKITSLLAA